MIGIVASALWFSIGLLLSAFVWAEISRKRENKMASGWIDREEYLRRIAASERELLTLQIQREREMAAVERKELYNRIQAYDPNVGNFTPPDYVAPPSRPGEATVEPRSFSEDDLGQMGLVTQADGMIRDTRNDELFESVEDWRSWQADLKKRNLPENVRPSIALGKGWEEAFAVAKQETAERKAARAAKN